MSCLLCPSVLQPLASHFDFAYVCDEDTLQPPLSDGCTSNALRLQLLARLHTQHKHSARLQPQLRTHDAECITCRVTAPQQGCSHSQHH